MASASKTIDQHIIDSLVSSGAPEYVTFIDEPEPEPLFCPIISVDDHVLEPATLFEGRLPAHLQDRAPHITWRDERPWWVIGDATIPILLVNGGSGRAMEEWTSSAAAYEEFRPAVWDPRARLHDMDLTGVWASLCFSSTLWGFAGTRFSTMADPELGLACLRAYNDWMVEDWCGAAPDRYIPCQLPWLRDPEVAAAEIRRNADRGYRAVSFSENPEGLGFANIYDRSWDPFLRACEETETVVNLHVGSSGTVRQPCSSSREGVGAALFPVSGIETLIDWVFAEIPLRFPDLTIALSEAGASWVPMAFERLARAHRQPRSVTRQWPAGSPDPVDLARRNFVFTSIEDPSAFRLLDIVNEDRIMVETDYPHFDSTWPACQAMIRSELAHLPAATIRKVCYENAARIYRHPLPPTAMIERSEVGAA